MKTKKYVSLFIAIISLFSVLLVAASALSWDGASKGGSTDAVNGSSTGYVIRETDDTYCVVGYRFSVVTNKGTMKRNKVIDIFRKTTNGTNAYSNSAKFSTKYCKLQLIENKDSKLSTTKNTTNCYKESSFSFLSELPNPDSVGTWQKYENNLNPVLEKIGVGSISGLSHGDKVIIEPLFDVCLAGEYQALTVTEIAYCGRSVLGGSSTGGALAKTSDTWGFIKNYTNKIWPNRLFTPDGQGLWTAAKTLTDYASFNKIITYGYGVGIAYTETKATVLTIAFTCNGTSPTFTDTSKGYSFGEYKRICTTTGTNKTISGTKNVYYQSLKYNNKLGSDGLHNFSTFGLSAPKGYLFKCWKGTKGEFDQSTQYSASQFSDDIANGDVTVWLTAKFKPIIYTVKYNGNGSTGGSTASSAHTYDTAKNLTANGFTKSGYTFKCWNTKADGSGTSYSNSQGVKNLSSTQGATVNLYAQWSPNKLTVCYDCYNSEVSLKGTTTDYGLGEKNRIITTVKKNKTVSGTANVLYQLFEYNNEIGGNGLYNFATFGLNEPTGYKFKSWKCTKGEFSQTDNTYKPTDFSDNILIGDDTVWLTAQFTPITYTIKYNGNGNTSGSTESSTHTYDVAKMLTANGFLKTGYVFKGWNTKADGSGIYYSDRQNVKNLSSVQGATINLYAQWSNDEKLLLEAIEPNAEYREGTDVISSFNLINPNSKAYIPEDNISVCFNVYKGETVIKTVTLSNVVVPANNKNLLYFKWSVPKNIGTEKIKITGEIIDGSSAYGQFSKTYNTCKYTVSETPDTQYEASAPDGFSVESKPANVKGSTTWSVWSYENGAFKKTNYGIAINDIVPTITPDTNANATLSNGIWTMKSGYGFGISVNNTVKSVSGYLLPDTTAYTVPQYSKVLFPEFSYSKATGKYRTLELVSGTWMFRTNGTYGKIHFTPLWYPDGIYSVSVIQQDCWTPAGMISRQVNSNNITISGSAYDDWYLN